MSNGRFCSWKAITFLPDLVRIKTIIEKLEPKFLSLYSEFGLQSSPGLAYTTKAVSHKRNASIGSCSLPYRHWRCNNDAAIT